MTDTNKKAAQARTRTAEKTLLDQHDTATPGDPLKGWFDLAKPSRSREQKSRWLRRGRK